MSVNYAQGLSAYMHKGKCGMPETFDSTEVLEQKVDTLVDWMKASRHTVVITGAGVSTASGIPDFRGPQGVWTLEEKGVSPVLNITFETAVPSLAHRALVSLQQAGYIKYLISQNVDGLHLRSGFPKNLLAELHGNMFIEQCDHCGTQFIRRCVVPTMALRHTGNQCTETKGNGRKCRGKLKDTILDWEDNLPIPELDQADQECRKAELCLCLGTSLQIVPCGNMPLLTKKNQGKICIVNLQPTKQDKKCDLKIHGYIDQVMQRVCSRLGVDIQEWSRPTVRLESGTPSGASAYRHYVIDVELQQEEKKSLKTEQNRPSGQNQGTGNQTIEQTGSGKQETGSCKQETGSVKQETGSSKQETGSSKQETGSAKQETGSAKQETGSGLQVTEAHVTIDHTDRTRSRDEWSHDDYETLQSKKIKL